MILDDGDRIIGYKVGLTSKPMQKMIGVDSPDYGPVLGLDDLLGTGAAVSMWAGSSSRRSRPRSIAVMG